MPDSAIAGTRLTVGPDIATMTDREIIDVFNGILAARTTPGCLGQDGQRRARAKCRVASLWTHGPRRVGEAELRAARKPPRPTPRLAGRQEIQSLRSQRLALPVDIEDYLSRITLIQR